MARMYEIWYSLSKDGDLEINLRHRDRSNDITDGLVGIFCKKALDRGIEIVLMGGMLEIGTDKSYNDYVIRLKEKKDTIDKHGK